MPKMHSEAGVGLAIFEMPAVAFDVVRPPLQEVMSDAPQPPLSLGNPYQRLPEDDVQLYDLRPGLACIKECDSIINTTDPDLKLAIEKYQPIIEAVVTTNRLAVSDRRDLYRTVLAEVNGRKARLAQIESDSIMQSYLLARPTAAKKITGNLEEKLEQYGELAGSNKFVAYRETQIKIAAEEALIRDQAARRLRMDARLNALEAAELAAAVECTTAAPVTRATLPAAASTAAVSADVKGTRMCDSSTSTKPGHERSSDQVKLGGWTRTVQLLDLLKIGRAHV